MTYIWITAAVLGAIIVAFIAGTIEGKRAGAIIAKKVLTPAEVAAQKIYNQAHADAQARINIAVATANKAGIKIDPIIIPTLNLPK